MRWRKGAISRKSFRAGTSTIGWRTRTNEARSAAAAASCAKSIYSTRCSSTSRASRLRTWTRSSGSSWRRAGRPSRTPATAEIAWMGAAAACTRAILAAITSICSTDRFPPRRCGGMRHRFFRHASPTTSICRDRRLRSIRPARAHWSRFTWPVRHCATGRSTSPWPVGCMFSVRRGSM